MRTLILRFVGARPPLLFPLSVAHDAYEFVRILAICQDLLEADLTNQGVIDADVYGSTIYSYVRACAALKNASQTRCHVRAPALVSVYIVFFDPCNSQQSRGRTALEMNLLVSEGKPKSCRRDEMGNIL